ncbi:hypothetical protein HG530_012587 [Fusarium avenaceum]|nr:hypothetical protein HG530_012587 [Fusarium avenaceum]
MPIRTQVPHAQLYCYKGRPPAIRFRRRKRHPTCTLARSVQSFDGILSKTGIDSVISVPEAVPGVIPEQSPELQDIPDLVASPPKGNSAIKSTILRLLDHQVPESNNKALSISFLIATSQYQTA